MTNLTLPYQVHFQHSSDSKDSVVFTSELRSAAVSFLKQQKKAFDGGNMKMYFEKDGNRIDGIGYYSEYGKWGFRYWIEEYQPEEPSLMSDQALDNELEYLRFNDYHWDNIQRDYTSRYQALSAEVNSRYEAKEASRKAEESKAIGLTIPEYDRLNNLKTCIRIWEPNQHVASHIPATVNTWKAEVQRLEALGISRLEEAEASRQAEEAEEAKAIQADRFSCNLDRFSRFQSLPSRSGLQALQLAAEILSAILQAENGYQPEATLASFQADLAEVMEGNLWIDSNGIVWKFLQTKGYFFPNCTLEESSVSAEALAFLQDTVRLEANQLGSGIYWLEELEANGWEERRIVLKDRRYDRAEAILDNIREIRQAIRLFQNYASRYSRYQVQPE